MALVFSFTLPLVQYIRMDILGLLMKRKHLWFPCGVGDLDEYSYENYKRLLKETDWQKWITEAQWDALVNEKPGPNKSKLKRRIAEWHVAIWRAADFDEELVEQAKKEARRLWHRFWAVQAFGEGGVTADLDDLSFSDISLALRMS